MIYATFFLFFQKKNAIVFYIPFDPFSLLDQTFKLSCGNIGKENLQRLKSISLDETGISTKEIYNPSSVPTRNIISVLELLLKKEKNYQENDRAIHFLIDECPEELLTHSYSKELAEGLEKHFRNSTVVIALQSVKKVREIKSSDKEMEPPIHQIDIQPLKDSSVGIFNLDYAVRMSFQLHKLQKELEADSQNSQFKAPLTFHKEKKGNLTFF